ncbi:outer membrane protein assembly factor BamD [Petrachloros mirabilis]
MESRSYALISVLPFVMVGLVVLSACSSNSKNSEVKAKKVLSGTDESIFFGDEIEKNYDPNVIMKRGEAFFDKEEYAEAIVEYNHFLDLHRTHMLAPYAVFRIGESQMKRAKGIERDPEPVQKAIQAFERLRKDYPGNRYEAQAAQKIQECHDLLAQSHLYVGQFYYRRGSYLAAAHRFEKILKQYPDKSVAPEALYYLALSYHDLGADDWAGEKLVLLAEKYPNSSHSKEGAALLAKIGSAEPVIVTANDPESAPPSNETGRAGQTDRPGIENGYTATAQPGSLQIPSANALRQGFVNCRLGTWC